MNAATDATYPSMGQDELMATQAVVANVEFWNEVQAEVQSQFDRLEIEVRRHVKGVVANSFRTRGDKFHLFTYRTFSLPDDTIDPVVVGLTFSPSGDRVAIEADVSGEQSGDSIHSLGTKTIPATRREVLDTARELAAQLFQSNEQIAKALRSSSRRID